jgi:hypothetical protein
MPLKKNIQVAGSLFIEAAKKEGMMPSAFETSNDTFI